DRMASALEEKIKEKLRKSQEFMSFDEAQSELEHLRKIQEYAIEAYNKLIDINNEFVDAYNEKRPPDPVEIAGYGQDILDLNRRASKEVDIDVSFGGQLGSLLGSVKSPDT